jgi:hypothetical protein
MRNIVPTEEIGSHMIHLPVQVGESTTTRFILDTGIGLNLVSSKFAARFGVEPNGEVYRGKRMSGQELSVPLAEVPVLAVGSCRRKNQVVGVFDMELPPEMGSIEGFLSPGFFGDVPFTICRQAHHVALEQADSMAARLRDGVVVPIQVERAGPSVSLFVGLKLPNGSEITAEVDTGSDILTLNARFMRELNIPRGGPGITKREGTDETGHHYVRYTTPIPGPVRLTHATDIAQSDVTAMFQEVIYDGLLGDTFLRKYDVTYDLPNSRLLFTPPRI